MLMARNASTQEALVLKGTLQGGMAGIGGEHTGFVLDGVSIEVDLSGVENAADLEGQAVLLQGSFEIKPYVERGPSPIFHVSAAKLASDRSPFRAPQTGPAESRTGSSDEIRRQALKLLQTDPTFRDEVKRLLAHDAGAAPQ
jgi:hypothetical protein